MIGRLLLAAALLALPVPALAQGNDIPALTKLIENQPGDMDRSVWKEKRREAARKLGASKDKRAVPVLIKLAESETFDIIGDIAIEGLGAIGDPSAVPALQRISVDNARDKATRELAKKALAKLPKGGAAPPPPPPPNDPPPPSDDPVDTGSDPVDPGPSDTSGTSEVGGGNTLFGDPKASSELPALPVLPDDTLAAYDRLTLAAGTAAASYDTVRRRPAFDADIAGRFQKRIERERMAWGVDAGAHVVGGFINPHTEEQTRGAQITIDGVGEARFYAGKIYGVGKAAVGTQVDYISISDDSGNRLKDTRTHFDVQLALGAGYGRVLDVGGAIRVRRLSRTLDAARALGKPIDDAIAKRLQLTWWALRGERSSYRALVSTVAILREAGILLGEPDAGLAYEMLTVLRDTQLDMRPSGYDVQLVFGEGYLVRPDMPPPIEEGRVEQLILTARYGKQLQDDKAELSGSATARLRLFAPDPDGTNPGQPSPWAAGATARFRKFAYGEHGDPLGAFDLTATAMASDDGCVTGSMTCPPIAARVEGQLGFTLWLSQASGVRLAASIAQEGKELFFGAELAATYGFLDATFAGL